MPQFVVLKGGKDEKNLPSYKFIDAFVTDTRLMGVLGLRVHWIENPDNPEEAIDVWHFYYYDVEELGLDTLSIYELLDEEGLKLATKACFGGLGAEMVIVSEKEAAYLIDWFIRSTKEKKQELPENVKYISGYLEGMDKDLTEDEVYELNRKMCIRTYKYGLINYYLMRSFGKDEEGVSLLRDRKVSQSCFEDLSCKKHATFLKNTIQDFSNSDGSISFLCESLIESEGQHYLQVSDITARDGYVIYAKKNNCFPISIEEASLLLVRREFCTVFAIVQPMEDFDLDFVPFTIGTTRTSHDNGDMYMEFMPDNSHAENKVFRLYDDIKTLYFVSDYGELIVAAYTEEEIKKAESALRKSILKRDIRIMVKMELARSVLFDFAQSNYTHFGAFIKSLE